MIDSKMLKGVAMFGCFHFSSQCQNVLEDILEISSEGEPCSTLSDDARVKGRFKLGKGQADFIHKFHFSIP